MNSCNMNELGLSLKATWAVGHFNVHNLEFVRAVVRAAEREQSLAVLAVGMLLSVKYMGGIRGTLLINCTYIVDYKRFCAYRWDNIC